MAPPSRQDTGTCDEGGTHDFRMSSSRSGWFKCLCCPCYLICGLAMSQGAALATAPVGFGASDERPDELTCVKCGLSPSEASALAHAKDAEARGVITSKGPGYFSNAGMSVPATPPPFPDTHSSQAPPQYPPPAS